MTQTTVVGSELALARLLEGPLSPVEHSLLLFFCLGMEMQIRRNPHAQSLLCPKHEELIPWHAAGTLHRRSGLKTLDQGERKGGRECQQQSGASLLGYADTHTGPHLVEGETPAPKSTQQDDWNQPGLAHLFIFSGSGCR